MKKQGPERRKFIERGPSVAWNGAGAWTGAGAGGEIKNTDPSGTAD